ncbi:MAG: OmpH family outer membrane protein [Pseudomonadota bacterium]
MRFRRLLLVGIALIFCSQNQAIGEDRVKIGVLNMQRLQQTSSSFQKVKEKLKKRFDTLRSKLEEEEDKILKLEEELRKQSLMLSLDAKEDKQRELEKKRRHYKYIYGEVTQEMKDAELDATRKVGREIEKVVEKIAKAEGYTIILEQGAVGLIYYNNAIEVTDRVTKAYDQIKQKED